MPRQWMWDGINAHASIVFLFGLLVNSTLGSISLRLRSRRPSRTCDRRTNLGSVCSPHQGSLRSSFARHSPHTASSLLLLSIPLSRWSPAPCSSALFCILCGITWSHSFLMSAALSVNGVGEWKRKTAEREGEKGRVYRAHGVGRHSNLPSCIPTRVGGLVISRLGFGAHFRNPPTC